MKTFTDKEPLSKIRDYCVKKKLSIAVAESVTSGLLQNSFSQAEDAMKFFQGGMTLYNLGQKTKHLHLNPIMGEDCNCVSKEVSEKMALEIAQKFCCEIGIGISGYAVEVPEMDITSKFAYLAVAIHGKIVISRKIVGLKKEGMFQNQVHFSLKTLQLLSHHMG